MGLIDSHAHLTDDHLIDDLASVLTRAQAAGVDRIITIAGDVADSFRVVALAAQERSVFAAVGVHPHQAAKTTAEELAKLPALLAEPGVVACGEIGLDYHYVFSDRRSQLEVFTSQLDMLADTSLPVVIHARQALDDTINLLFERGFDGRRVVFHCFTGTPAEADRIAQHGWRISLTGVVTFKSAVALREVARSYPAHKLMIETDCPYLSPVPVRGVFPNEPAHLAHTAAFLAKLRGVEPEELAQQTSANTVEFFGLANPD